MLKRESRWTLPQGVCLIMTRPDGQVLLHRRCRRARLYPGRWAFFGGGVEEGEVPIDAIAREVREETGMHSLLFTELWATVHHKPYLTVCDHSFFAMYDGQEIVLAEGERYGWFRINEALVQCGLPPHEASDLCRFRRVGMLKAELLRAS